MNFVVRTIGLAANLLTGGAITKEYERAFYEGAKSTRLNRDFNITNNHFELQAGTDREMLKARARWLAANNPITKSIDRSIVKNVVGKGISLQSRVKEEDLKSSKQFNQDIENLWNEFIKKEHFDVAGRLGSYQSQKLSLKTKMTDGEMLVNKVWTKDKKFPLKFQFIESDQFDTRLSKYNKNDVFSGVEVDSYGRPVAYHLKESINSFSSKRFDAKNIIHYFDIERSSQYRGISDYAQVINNLKDFAAYNDSEIVKNRILSSFGLFIKTTDLGKSMFGDKKAAEKQSSSEPIKEITAGMIKYLRQGEEVQTVQSTQQGNSYNDFVTTTIRLISAGRDISYELAFRDYSKVNFASARAGLIQDNKRFDDEQQCMVLNLLNPMFEAFIDSQVLVGNLKVPNDYYQNKHKYIKPVWVMPEREWVDPLKDIKATEKEIDLGINSKTRAAAAKGRNFEDIIDEQIAEEVMVLKKEKNAKLPIKSEDKDAKTN